MLSYVIVNTITVARLGTMPPVLSWNNKAHQHPCNTKHLHKLNKIENRPPSEKVEYLWCFVTIKAFKKVLLM